MNMTDRDAPDHARPRRSPLPKWLLWPITFGLAVAGAIGFYNDAVSAKLVWLYWAVVILVGAFYAIALVVYVIRFVRWGWRRWRDLAAKAKAHDALAVDLERWEKAAGAATARAEDAEKRLKTWHGDTLTEGRRRVLAEARAMSRAATFREIEVAVANGVLVIGAKWQSERPAVDSRYVLRSTTLNQVKAVLECIEIRENHVVVFQVASVVTDSYRADLLRRAGTTGSTLADVEITARADSLEKEAIWPES
ncbi:glycosyltransferase, probably [Microbacterium testaceum StLB037]|uniref:Glycosyltransferase, probably n=2 Tax=Microbacterium testaceum TaxID=2033 RepID=E8NBE9_MICTS|nr:glycosyltransferase, probably [Microbacterium testaceum StLB037]